LELSGKQGKKSMANPKQEEDGSSSETYPSVAKLAKELNMCERSVRDALRRNEIPHIKLGKRYILPKAAIRRWLEEAGGHPLLNVMAG
jgi:excisionase family DNA binding protein